MVKSYIWSFPRANSATYLERLPCNGDVSNISVVPNIVEPSEIPSGLTCFRYRDAMRAIAGTEAFAANRDMNGKDGGKDR